MNIKWIFSHTLHDQNILFIYLFLRRITEHTKVIPRGYNNLCMTKNYPRKETGRECDLTTGQQVQSYPFIQPRALTRLPLAN